MRLLQQQHPVKSLSGGANQISCADNGTCGQNISKVVPEGTVEAILVLNAICPAGNGAPRQGGDAIDEAE